MIEASSNPGDLLDAFCGCGTQIAQPACILKPDVKTRATVAKRANGMGFVMCGNQCENSTTRPRSSKTRLRS